MYNCNTKTHNEEFVFQVIVLVVVSFFCYLVRLYNEKKQNFKLINKILPILLLTSRSLTHSLTRLLIHLLILSLIRLLTCRLIYLLNILKRKIYNSM